MIILSYPNLQPIAGISNPVFKVDLVGNLSSAQHDAVKIAATKIEALFNIFNTED